MLLAQLHQHWRTSAGLVHSYVRLDTLIPHSQSKAFTAPRSGIVVDSTRDENLWGSVLGWAERAGLFMRAQTANARDVSAGATKDAMKTQFTL